MERRVAHFVRKLLPPAVSFIRNQIMSHENYVPFIVYKEYVDSGFAREIKQRVNSLFLEDKKRGMERITSALLYDNLRMLTKADVAAALEYVNAHAIDIVHCHYGSDATMFLRIVQGSKIPSLVSFYGYDCSSFPRRYLGFAKYLLLNVFRHVDYVLAMSEDMEFDLVNLGCPKEKIIVHYYGTDVQHFALNRKYDEKQRVNLLIVSSLDEKKGHLDILKALGKVRQSNKIDIRFRVVGDGPLAKILKEYVKQHNLCDKVTFIGPLRYLSEEFLKEFYNADIFIHPSVVAPNGDKEGIPGTIVEAMATGLPVISTYHAGIPSVIQHGKSGLLVKESDTQALADSISRLAENAESRRSLGHTAQKYAFEKLDLRQKEIELESIYDRVIAEYKRQ